jgi:hypothetical protein
LSKKFIERIPIRSTKEINPESWKHDNIISIIAGTGAGKSWFIKNKLYDHAKVNNQKILMLVHRLNCKNQFKKELDNANKSDVIHVQTYQSIESKYKKNEKFDFSPYQYIVSDEFHYFMADAAFNHTTDISLEAILSQTEKTKIFMSATGDTMVDYLSGYRKFKVTLYEQDINYGFIKDLRFFNKEETLEKFIIEAIEKNKKAIFFIQSASTAFELYKKYKEHCLFNCSKSNPHYKFVDKTKIDNMLEKERFEELILITTTCMDAGVNIIDKELQNIVCDVEDIGTLIQCIGRKRIREKGDGIRLHIKTVNNQQIGQRMSELSKKREHAKFLKEHGLKDYIEKYYRDIKHNNGIVYDEMVNGNLEKKINYLMYFRCLIDENTYDQMVNKFGDFAYCKQLARIFGYVDHNGNYMYTIIEEEEKITDLNQYLDSIVGKVMLQPKDRTELIEKMNVKQNRRLLKSLDSLNSALREQDFNFYIKQFETSRIDDGQKKKFKSAWKVLRLVEK